MKTEEREKQLQYVLNAIKYSLDCLELKAEIVTDSKSVTVQIKLAITSDKLPMFEADISGCYSKDTHLKLWLRDRWHRDLSNHDLNRTDRLTYEFCCMLPDAELEKIGIPKVGYSRTLSPLMVEFKADKNPKLIVRDVESSLVVYKRLVEAVAEPIQKRIEQEDATIKLLNAVSNACGYNRHYNVPSRTTFRHEKIGQITVYEYGTVEVASNIEPDALLKMLGN
jgi:hypothetical protein